MRRAGIALFAVVVIVVVAVVTAYATAWARLQPDPETLAHSVARAALVGWYEPCERLGSRWRCEVSPGSGGAVYRVSFRSRRCWTAVRLATIAAEGPSDERLRGCLRVRDRHRWLSVGPSRFPRS